MGIKPGTNLNPFKKTLDAQNKQMQDASDAMSGLKGAPKQGVAGTPLSAPAQGGAAKTAPPGLTGTGKQGVAGSSLTAPAPTDMTGAGKQGAVAEKPLAAPAPGGALMGAGKQGAAPGKPLTAPATTGFKTAQPAGMKINQATAEHKAGSAAFDNAKSNDERRAADAKMSQAQVDIMKAQKQGSTSKAPTAGQTIGTRTPARPGTAAPATKPGASKVLPNAMNKKK